jgi:hypothetical protein
MSTLSLGATLVPAVGEKSNGQGLALERRSVVHQPLGDDVLRDKSAKVVLGHVLKSRLVTGT